ncbi:MAG TPA: hypothetical protein VNQ74_11420, partial [Burkholderiaceae bacterium]|nr:hypothetical protein [Burkholderiaceae bacterium]
AAVLRQAAHHGSSRKIDSTFVLRPFQGNNQFGAIGEPAVVRINCAQAGQPEVLISHRINSGTVASHII